MLHGHVPYRDFFYEQMPLLPNLYAQARSDYTNRFAPVAAAKLSPAAARRYHVASETELERLIR